MTRRSRGDLRADLSDRDALRVYADALLERDDPQGEAIHLACELETMSYADARRPRLECRYEELADVYGEQWKKPFTDRLPAARYVWDVGVELVRGLPAGLSGSLDRIVEHLDTLPGIQAIDADRADADACDKLAASEAFSRLAHLRLVTDRAGLAKLVAARRFPALERLGVGILDAAGIEVLCGCAAVRSLRQLAIEGQGGAYDLEPLLARSGETLEALALDNVALGKAGVEMVARHCPNLRVLRLTRAALDAKAAEALAGARAFRTVESLALGGNPLGEAGVAAIAGSQTLARVVRVSFERAGGGPPFGALLLRAFAGALVWKKLLALDLTRCNVREAGAKLLRGKAFQSLQELGLEGNALGDKGIAALAAIRSLRALRVVNLARNTLTATGMARLARARWLGTVEELALDHNKFQSAGGQNLAKGDLGKLRVLSIGHNWMGSVGMRAILDNAPALTTIRAGANNYASTVFAEALAYGEPAPPLRELATYRLDRPLLDALLAAPGVGTLRRLRLHSVALDDARAERLAATAAFDNLVRLEVISEKLGDAGRAALAKRFGDRVTFS